MGNDVGKRSIARVNQRITKILKSKDHPWWRTIKKPANKRIRPGQVPYCAPCQKHMKGLSKEITRLSAALDKQKCGRCKGEKNAAKEYCMDPDDASKTCTECQ